MSKITHIAGTFLIQADGAFLNGAGIGSGEDRNVTVPKILRKEGKSYPYVSAQSWRRWLRNTVCEEAGWKPSELRAIGLSEKNTSNKISGEIDPVDFPEDDIFGYMRAESGQGKNKISDDLDEDANESEDEEFTLEIEVGKKKKGEKTKAVIRTSPFMSSILLSLRSQCINKDEGFVHLKEGTPLPYSTQFYDTDLQGIFCLDYSRLGRFINVGDKIELDEKRISEWIKQNKVEESNQKDVYELVDRNNKRRERASAILQAIAVLRGGAKQAAFGTDVSPKAIIVGGLNCGNPVFNDLFETTEKGVKLKINTLLEIAKDYKDRIITSIYIGMRTGYLENEDEIRTNLKDNETIIITTPIEAMKKMAECLK